MFLHYFKKLPSLLVTLLVLLQVMSPLLHHHPVGSSLNEKQGVHLHLIDFGLADSSTNLDMTSTLSTQSIVPQVIGVPIGNETKLPLLPILVLVYLYLVLLLDSSIFRQAFFLPEAITQQRTNPRFSPTQLRAPPL